MVTAVKRTGRGGPRLGAGRPRGGGTGVRRNRVVIMVTDAELAKLQRLAEEKGLPIGTVTYQIVGTSLSRRR